MPSFAFSAAFPVFLPPFLRLCRFIHDFPNSHLLGDFVYRSNTNINCSKQVIDAYKECGRTLVSITEVPLEKVVHYGILHGVWNVKCTPCQGQFEFLGLPSAGYSEII